MNSLYKSAVIYTKWRKNLGASYWLINFALSVLFGRLFGIDMFPSIIGGLTGLFGSHVVISWLSRRAGRLELTRAWTDSQIYTRHRGDRRKEAAKMFATNGVMSLILPLLWRISDITRWAYYNRPLMFSLVLLNLLIFSLRICSILFLVLTVLWIYESDSRSLTFLSVLKWANTGFWKASRWFGNLEIWRLIDKGGSRTTEDGNTDGGEIKHTDKKGRPKETNVSVVYRWNSAKRGTQEEKDVAFNLGEDETALARLGNIEKICNGKTIFWKDLTDEEREGAEFLGWTAETWAEEKIQSSNDSEEHRRRSLNASGGEAFRLFNNLRDRPCVSKRVGRPKLFSRGSYHNQVWMDYYDAANHNTS